MLEALKLWRYHDILLKRHYKTAQFIIWNCECGEVNVAIVSFSKKYKHAERLCTILAKFLITNLLTRYYIKVSDGKFKKIDFQKYNS
jgi:hypothetical protein